MIGAMAGGGYASTAAASYGLFDNESEMALTLDFLVLEEVLMTSTKLIGNI